MYVYIVRVHFLEYLIAKSSSFINNLLLLSSTGVLIGTVLYMTVPSADSLKHNKEKRYINPLLVEFKDSPQSTLCYMTRCIQL